MIHPNIVDQLQMFVMAAELGSFSATAKRLGRAQNVVSYGISTLEQNMDVALFDRSGHKAVLTTSGEALKKEAQHIIRATSALTRKANELSSGLEPVLTIAVDDMVPFSILEPALVAMAGKYPGLELRINRTAGRDAWKQVSDGRAAVGVAVDTYGLEREQDIVVVGFVRIVPVISMAVQLDGLDADGFDIPDFRQIVLSGSDTPEDSPDYGVFSPHIWRVPDLKSKHDLIRQGLGWGTLPRHLVQDDLTSGLLRRLNMRQFTVDQQISLKLFSHGGAPLGLAARFLKENILDSARAAAGTSNM